MEDVLTASGHRGARPDGFGRGRRILLAITVAVASIVLVPPETSLAAGQCGPTQTGNYHSGFRHDPDTYPGYDFEGVSGYIVVRDGGLCGPTSYTFSNAYVMIASGAGGYG